MKEIDQKLEQWVYNDIIRAEIQLGNLIYKPYKICSLPANFGCIEFNEKEGISQWFNYKGYTYLFEKVAKS